MKKVLMAVIAIAVVAMAGLAAAATTNVPVQARVVGTCRFNSTPPTLDFTDLTFDLAGNPNNAVATGSMTFWCTRNASYTIADDDGQYETGANANRLRSTSLTVPEYIPYTFAYNPIGGTGSGPLSNITVSFTANILGADHVGVSPDTYTDVVQVTVNP